MHPYLFYNQNFFIMSHLKDVLIVVVALALYDLVVKKMITKA